MARGRVLTIVLGRLLGEWGGEIAVKVEEEVEELSESISVLHWACTMGEITMMRDLLSRGHHVDAVDDNGFTSLQITPGSPLHHVDPTLGLRIVKELLRAGADVNARTAEKTGSTPLILACRLCGGYDVVEALLRGGADVNARCNQGLEALHYSCMFGHLAELEPLLKYGADIDTAVGKNTFNADEGCTPLHYAAVGGHALVVQELIRKGACVSATSMHGETPHYAAQQAGYGSIVKMLLSPPGTVADAGECNDWLDGIGVGKGSSNKKKKKKKKK
jgi:ankyrin repeat protein